MTDFLSEAEPADPRAVRRATIVRLATGLAQGLLLYGLYRADRSHAWPATQREVYGALLLIFLFTPFVVQAGVSALRWRTLAAWKAVAALVAGGLGAYGVWSGDPAARGVDALGPQTFFAVAALIFIGHHLVQPADIERRRIAAYPTYFDVTWKHGVQGALSVGFTGAFWLLLFLAAALFKLIGVEAIDKLIKHEAFAFPATAVMFAAAVQLTDVRANLVRGVRTVALTLLSWLLPLMTLIAAAFLATLPFTGLEPLWRTKSATAILLVADAFLILLTNAAYQDGTERAAVVLKWAARLAGLLLVPITGLAAYGLSLRIGQYGLSPDRIIAAACVLVAAGYALGYAVAAVRPGAWMRTLEATNIAMAFGVIVVLLALFTPLADPRRLSVSDQVARLHAGKASPAAFDYQFLRFDAGRAGRDALERLRADPSAEIAKRAKAAEAQTERLYNAEPNPPPRPPRIAFHPADARPPEGFLSIIPEEPRFGGCLSGALDCDAQLLDVTGDGQPEVLVSPGWPIEVYGAVAGGAWRKLGSFQPPCSGFDSRAAIREGRLGAATPAVRDLISPQGAMRFEKELEACPRENRK
ncbi:DUF4153 domain-containing protein [Caulobacter sp. BK020]|uniref:DUF4153 domain-containing protein n=1 Tax=Caulobacter sp. BK020 TaxID=2512117 RepID=UPI00104CDC9A|nr:DUF4153 domain-containing protein [Caulobacter sp. BK020]TCS13240.1 uncharacterized protein DUF4153 [Caulobacter sp. BK020]